MISNIGHVALRVPDLDASVQHATHVMGLIEVERTADAAYLALPSHMLHPTPHHAVQYIQGAEAALDHIALEAPSEAALQELRERLAGAGVSLISDEVEEPGIAAAIRFAGPAGHVFEVYAGMEEELRRGSNHAVKPRRLGHITIQAGESIAPTADFLADVLGFRASDYMNFGDTRMAAFYRCTALHHGIGLVVGPPGVHHYALEVPTPYELLALGDVLDQVDGSFIWGPGRHAAGDNIAVYHRDAAGVVVEHFTDMQLIFNDSWQPREWAMEEPRGFNRWGELFSETALVGVGVGLAAPSSTTVG